MRVLIHSYIIMTTLIETRILSTPEEKSNSDYGKCTVASITFPAFSRWPLNTVQGSTVKELCFSKKKTHTRSTLVALQGKLPVFLHLLNQRVMHNKQVVWPCSHGPVMRLLFEKHQAIPQNDFLVSLCLRNRLKIARKSNSEL